MPPAGRHCAEERGWIVEEFASETETEELASSSQRDVQKVPNAAGNPERCGDRPRQRQRRRTRGRAERSYALLHHLLHTSSVPGTFSHPRSLRAGSSRGQLKQLSFTASAFVVYLVAPTPTEVDPRAEAPKWDWHIPDSKFWGSHNRVFAL